MAADFFLGESLVGDGNEIAHIDLVIGSKSGPAGAAFCNALTNNKDGFTTLLAVVTPNLPAKPDTIMFNKVTIKGAKQAVQMFGPAQAAVARAVVDSVEAASSRRTSSTTTASWSASSFTGKRPTTEDLRLQLPGDERIHPARPAGKPNAADVVARAKTAKHPFAATPRRSTASASKSQVRTLSSGSRDRPARLGTRRARSSESRCMRKLLLQLDTSPHPSVFDRVVAFDGGADEVMSYGGVTADAVRDLVHGCIFTRGPKDLHNTAIFIGGTDMAAGERLLKAVRQAFFGPFTVSVMLDSNGSNTTAVAAVAKLLQTTGGAAGQRAVDHRRHRSGRLAGRRPAGQGGRRRDDHLATARAIAALLEGFHQRFGGRMHARHPGRERRRGRRCSRARRCC